MVVRRGLGLLSLFVLGTVSVASARSEGPTWSDPGWRQTVSHVDVTFDASGRSSTVDDFEFVTLDEDGARRISLQVFPYDGAFETLDLEGLSTIKADGRVIPVDTRAVKDQPSSTDVASPYFDERRVKIVAFPNVASGDRIRGRIRLTGTRARFPGAFATVWTRSVDAPPGILQLTVTGPAAMPLHVAARGVSDVAEVAGSTVVHHVTFAETTPVRRRSSMASFDDAARFEASTFADYAAFSAALRTRNAPMAVPDSSVARRSAEIVGDAATDRTKVERIHDWVAANIRYVGIGLDDGGWTSQPAEAVLSAGYGDCKGHATLLKALLAAQGITADLVLVNTEPQYTLTEVATPNFDHAIVFVPGLGLYLDPTASSTAFGSLPSYLYGKPALDVDQGRLATIPVMKPEDFTLSSETDYVLLPDGTRHATSRFIGSGVGATLGRRVAEWLTTKDRAALAARNLSEAGLEGSGTYDFPDPHRLSPSFVVTAPFAITRALDLGSPVTISMLPSTDPRPPLAGLVARDGQEGEFVCPAIDAGNIASLVLPDGISLYEKPADLHSVTELEGVTAHGRVTGHIAIDGRVWLDGRIVHSSSRITATFSAPVCPESFGQRIRDAIGKLDVFKRGGVGLTPFAVSFVTDRGSPFAAGLQAHQAGHYAKALVLLLPLADGGQAEAQNEVGLLYESGSGVPQDLNEAFRWYLRSAAQGNPLGQSHLGYCYRMGFGVARNEERAAVWNRRSAAQGFPYAEYNLAEMYVEGAIQPPDMTLAIALFEKAAAHGYAAAADQLGFLYQTGKGVPQDYGRAIAWYGRASAKGEAYADAQLGDLYALGEGVPVDYKKAAFHLRRAADKDFARSQFELGWIYENGLGVAAEPGQAMFWYAKAAHLGHAEAQRRLDMLRHPEEPSLWSRIVRFISG